MGLNFAIAISEYDNETENILHPSYGNISFNTLEWGAGEDGAFWERIGEIPNHICTQEELGLVGGNSNFMPLAEKSFSTIKSY